MHPMCQPHLADLCTPPLRSQRSRVCGRFSPQDVSSAMLRPMTARKTNTLHITIRSPRDMAVRRWVYSCPAAFFNGLLQARPAAGSGAS